MGIKRYIRQIVKAAAFGGEILPSRFFIAQQQPQREVTVWLHGLGSPRDVTRCHAPASSVPCTFWIAFSAGESPQKSECSHLSLLFCERSGKQRVLGRIGLRWNLTIPAGDGEILVFEAHSARNYCYPKHQLFAHTFLQAWRQRRVKSNIRLSRVERCALSVLFICPRPVSLVSVTSHEHANIFPLNVMNDLHNGHFAFALTACKTPAQLLQAAGCFALSVTPIKEGPVAFKLAENHNRSSIKWSELPFETRPSTELGIPVPAFSPRIREMRIESVHTIGSHSLFVAHTISDELLAGGTELSVIHGFYQGWRLRHGLDDKSSIVEDARIRSAPEFSSLPV